MDKVKSAEYLHGKALTKYELYDERYVTYHEAYEKASKEFADCDPDVGPCTV